MLPLFILAGLLLLGLITLLLISAHVTGRAKKYLPAPEQTPTDEDCILVLGCKLLPDGTPSRMLRDRLLRALALYRARGAARLLLSGTPREVDAMVRFITDRGIPHRAIVADRDGLTTFESIFRADTEFGCRKILIVTQKYHLYRAVYIARQLGLEAWGVSADLDRYSRRFFRQVREVLARCKAFLMCRFRK